MSSEPNPTPATDNSTKQMLALIEQANSGNETVVPQIRELMRQAPELIDALGGDLSLRTERTLVERLTGEQLALKESLTHKLHQLRDELSGPKVTPLEKLLVDRVVACWLHVQFADQQLFEQDEVTLNFGEYLQRQQDRAHRRFLAAVKTLSTVRRLALPILVDVNVSPVSRSET